MIILGIDPGSRICGYGAIEVLSDKIELIEYGVVDVAKKSLEIPERLKEIYIRLKEVSKRTKPDIAALESMFYSKNAQSLMKLSHARGAAILAVAMNDVPVVEYSPREVKKAVSGRGNAGKEQVQFMVKRLLNIDETPEFFDSTDALAVAICHSLRHSYNKGGKNSWGDYIKNNPGRVVSR